MKKCLALVLWLSFATVTLHAQSKVFKEVSDEISSQMQVITQDDALVGYMVFTQLEKANADSFNYKITMMDENLNDIGTVNFRQVKLELQSVSFDQDVLCLGYLKSDLLNEYFSSNKSLKKAVAKDKSAVITQFLNLDGKILKTNVIPVEPSRNNDYYSSQRLGTLKHNIQLKNIPGKGFACFFGDTKSNKLLIYNTKGEVIQEKKIDDAKGGFAMLTSKSNVYLLSKNIVDKAPEGGYDLQGYNIADSIHLEKIALKDKNGSYLKILAFQNDPVTGNPYLSGCIINPKMGEKFIKARHIAKGAYSGVFTINVDGPKKADIKEVYTYWGDGSQMPDINMKGYYASEQFYAKYYEAIKDFEGNTYFVGSSFVKKPKIGAIVSSVLLSPFIVFPIFILGVGGTSKVKVKDVVFLKQSATGSLSVSNTVECNNSNFMPSKVPFAMLNNRSFYTTTNTSTKTNYAIIDDKEDIFIYNISTKRTVRTVPHKEGKVLTNIYPAKEGYIMVAEFNKKEKYSKFSIEAL